MDVLNVLGFVLFGVAAGFLIFVAILGYYVKKGYNAAKELKPKPVDPSVSSRLKEAAEMTKEQNDIMAASSIPSSNALHSRHKNGLIARYKELEKMKMEVLTSIVKEGHDPMVTVFNAQTNQNEELPLSQFLQVVTGAKSQEAQPEAQPPIVPPESTVRKVEKNGKTFFVISGGKSTSTH